MYCVHEKPRVFKDSSVARLFMKWWRLLCLITVVRNLSSNISSRCSSPCHGNGTMSCDFSVHSYFKTWVPYWSLLHYWLPRLGHGCWVSSGSGGRGLHRLHLYSTSYASIQQSCCCMQIAAVGKIKFLPSCHKGMPSSSHELLVFKLD